MSTHTYATQISFDVVAKEGTTLRQLNTLWNKMAAVAQDEDFVEGVDLGNASGVSFTLEDETDALEAYD